MNIDNSIFLAPHDSDSDEVALPKLRAYHASRIENAPAAYDLAYWQMYADMTDEELLLSRRLWIAKKQLSMANAARWSGHE